MTSRCGDKLSNSAPAGRCFKEIIIFMFLELYGLKAQSDCVSKFSFIIHNPKEKCHGYEITYFLSKALVL